MNLRDELIRIRKETRADDLLVPWSDSVEYGKAVYRFAMEAAARKCEALLIHNETGVDYTDGCDDCADAIRDMKERA